MSTKETRKGQLPKSYTIYRMNKDGSIFVVGCVEEACAIGGAIDQDRENIDFEAVYRVIPEYQS